MSISPRTLRPSSNFSPRSISGLALWLDASSSALYTTDAGPVVAVTDPRHIAGCVGWWDASEASTLFAADTGETLATTTVGRWANKVSGGSDKDLVQTDITKRPTITANYIGGMQSLVFDGVNDALTRAFTLDATCHLFCVLKWPAAYASTVRATDGFTGNTLSILRFSNTAISVIGSSPTILAGTGNTLAPLIVEARKSTSGRFAINGAGQSEGSLDTTATNGLTLGAFGGGGSAFDNVGIAEVIAFSDPLSVADAARVSAYLAAKWSIAGVHSPATASSDPVGYWADKSGNGRHAVQATAGSRPTISATAQNGRKALTFDGTNGWMRTERTNYAARSVFTVFRRTGTAPLYSSPFSKQSNVAGDYGGSSYAVAYGNEGGWSIVGSGTGRMNYGSNGSPHKLSAAYMRGAAMPLADAQNYQTGIVAAPNTTDAELLYAEAATDTDGNQAWFLGTEPFATMRKYPANILELLIYNRALTTAERQRAERYLAARWGITLAPQVSNADAQNWINRVYSNGGSVSSATAGAVNSLCDSLDASGVRPLMYRMGIFAGSNLNSALVPLYRGPSLGGTQYGNTTDTNVSSLFVGANYGETTGLTAPASSTNYLDTGFTTVDVPASVYQSMHMSGWHGPMPVGDADPIFLGVHSTERHSLQVAIRSTVPAAETGRMGKTATVLATNGIQGARPSAFLLTQRTSAISLQLYRNGVLDNTTATSVTGIGTVAIPVFVFRYNNAGTVAGESLNTSLRHYSIGDDMTEPQVLAFYNALAAFNTAMGRTA